jgi:hypothetical protein
MGIITSILGTLFGGTTNVVKETAEVFRENAEGQAQREAEVSRAALAQFAAEFGLQRRGWFDQLMDGANRIPRPALAMGTLGLFIVAMYDPIWFAERMQGLSLVPEPLWWLLGAIVSFYFGARHQSKDQEFQRSLATSVLRATQVADNVRVLRALDAGSSRPAATDLDAEVTLELTTTTEENAALEEWRRSHAR